MSVRLKGALVVIVLSVHPYDIVVRVVKRVALVANSLRGAFRRDGGQLNRSRDSPHHLIELIDDVQAVVSSGIDRADQITDCVVFTRRGQGDGRGIDNFLLKIAALWPTVMVGVAVHSPMSATVVGQVMRGHLPELVVSPVFHDRRDSVHYPNEVAPIVVVVKGLVPTPIHVARHEVESATTAEIGVVFVLFNDFILIPAKGALADGEPFACSLLNERLRWSLGDRRHEHFR